MLQNNQKTILYSHFMWNLEHHVKCLMLKNGPSKLNLANSPRGNLSDCLSFAMTSQLYHRDCIYISGQPNCYSDPQSNPSTNLEMPLSSIDEFSLATRNEHHHIHYYYNEITLVLLNTAMATN